MGPERTRKGLCVGEERISNEPTSLTVKYPNRTGSTQPKYEAPQRPEANGDWGEEIARSMRALNDVELYGYPELQSTRLDQNTG
jgi:hypothetical protein